MQALLTEATDLLFGGASEGGKSHFIRMALIIFCTMIPGLQTFIFRKFYQDVIGNHMESPSGFRMMLAQWQTDKIVKITENEIRWPRTGSLISLNQIQHTKDLEKHQGREKHVLVLDESTQIPQAHINGLMAWTRMPQEMKDKLPEQLKDLFPHIEPEDRKNLFPRCIKTANPIGLSVGYHKRRFVLPRKEFAIEKVGAWKVQYIPSRVIDNPSADPIAQKERLSELGEAQAAALISGDWTQPLGDFYEEYNDDLHAIPDLIPPGHWFKYKTHDWGGRDPFAVYWIAVSDGEEFKDQEGLTRWYPRGALIYYREWYGCNPEHPERGINMRNEDIAKGIVERTKETTSNITLSDNFPFADRGASKNGRRYVMADEYAENGCPLTLGNTARVYGWKQGRSRLQGVNGVPMVYICYNCIYLRQYLPALPRHETKAEDAAESGEATHSCDAWRLGCAAKPFIWDEEVTVAPKFKTDNLSPTPQDLLKQIKKKNAPRY